MNTTTPTPAMCCQYELEIAIDAPADRVWEAIFEETNYWWLPDFHVMGTGSTLTFDRQPGGRGLVEQTETGGALLWFHVHMLLPEQHTVYLFGHVAPEWGGPNTSSLKLAVESNGDGCVLKVTDARHGQLDQQHLESNEAGWLQLFTDGLKHHVETNAQPGS